MDSGMSPITLKGKPPGSPFLYVYEASGLTRMALTCP